MQVYPASSPRSREGALLGEHVFFKHHIIARTEASSSSLGRCQANPRIAFKQFVKGNIVWAQRSLCAPLNKDRSLQKFYFGFARGTNFTVAIAFEGGHFEGGH
jgi:hypothetical protein